MRDVIERGGFQLLPGEGGGWVLSVWTRGQWVGLHDGDAASFADLARLCGQASGLFVLSEAEATQAAEDGVTRALERAVASGLVLLSREELRALLVEAVCAADRHRQMKPSEIAAGILARLTAQQQGSRDA